MIIFNKYKLIEDKDYILLFRSEEQESKTHGGNNKKMYFLTLDSFKYN
jgi:phage anti-repressor protein